MPGLTEAPDVPRNKVEALGDGLWRPRLVIQQELAPLGLHTSEEAAKAAYDAAKLRVRGWGGDKPQLAAATAHLLSTPRLLLCWIAPLTQIEPAALLSCHQAALDLGRDLTAMKLHRPAAAYTAHPLWWRLLPGRCSFGEACSLLAHGLAAGLLAPACEAAGHLKAAEAAAAAAAQAELAGHSQRQQQGASPAETPSPPVPHAGPLLSPVAHAITEQRRPAVRLVSVATPDAVAEGVAQAQMASGEPTDPRVESQPPRRQHWHQFPAGSGQFVRSLAGQEVATGHIVLPGGQPGCSTDLGGPVVR